MPPTAPHLSKLDVLRSQTLTRLVQEEVIRQIKTGELAAGTKLNEIDIAERLQISRSPTREAFAALEEAGLVRLEKNRGAFIREISASEAAELYDVRRGLDEMAGQILAINISEYQISSLKDKLSTLDEILNYEDMDAYYDANIEFHDQIVQMTGNVTLLGIYRQVVNRMHLLRRRGFLLHESGKASRDEHHLIVEALGHRDATEASRLMGDHVARGYLRFKKAADQNSNPRLAPPSA